nr:type I-D CRISPR-associated helicase Cas3' [Candidatus Sigynarchaeota archaeon]
MDEFTIALPPMSIRAVPSAPRSSDAKDAGWLELVHQKATTAALTNNDVVINDNSTGSGKTRAALGYLKTLASKYAGKMFYCVLYVAPVNCLATQVINDVIDFLDDEHLRDEFIAFPVTSKHLQDLGHLLHVETGVKHRNGMVLATLLSNPVARNEIITKYIRDELGKASQDVVYEARNYILVINPDILYHVIFDVYYSNEKKNLHVDLLKNVKYLIFDEFHYYDLFQLTTFFTMATWWKVSGHMMDGAGDVKFCLLSATPNEHIMRVLRDDIGMKGIEINDFTIPSLPVEENIPFLSPVALHVHERDAKEPISVVMRKAAIDAIIELYLDAGKYGAVIANSLHHVTEIFHDQNMTRGARYSFKRITGTITAADRREAQEARCIFATSTVDIGFNFTRKTSAGRQNIDFLFIDFRSFDELVQRLGRAGRVLGKSMTDIPSDVHIFLPRGLYQACKEAVGKPSLVAGKTRPEILCAIEPFFPQKPFHSTFFRQYGYFMGRIFIDAVRSHDLMEPWRGKRDAQKEPLYVAWEEMLARVHGHGKDDKASFRLHVLYGYSKIAGKRRLDKLDEKYQRAFLYHAITDRSYLYHDPDIDASSVFDKAWLGQVSSMGKEKGAAQACMIESLVNDKVDSIDALETKGLPVDPKLIFEDNGLFKGLFGAFRTDVERYIRYITQLFEDLRGSFRSSSIDLPSCDIEDPGELLGSQTFSYDIFHVMRYFDFSIIDDWQGYTRISINNMLAKPAAIKFMVDFRASGSMTLAIFEKGIDQTLGVKRYLYKLVFFERGLELKTDCQVPRQLANRLRQPIIGYVIPNGMQFGYLFPFAVYPLIAKFPSGNEMEYSITFGKDALLLKSMVEGRETKNQGADSP